MPSRGRPTKFSFEIQEAIVKSLKIGATRKDAAGAVGIDYQTFLNWLERGKNARHGIFFDFFVSVSRAESQARLSYLNVIASAANDGDWHAALEYLKRRDRENWGDNVNVTQKSINVNIEMQMEMMTSGLSEEKQLELYDTLDRAQRLLTEAKALPPPQIIDITPEHEYSFETEIEEDVDNE